MHCHICVSILRILSQRKIAIGTTGGGLSPSTSRGQQGTIPRAGKWLPGRRGTGDWPLGKHGHVYHTCDASA